MNINYFSHKFSSVLLNDENDHYFGTLKFLSGGTTSPRIAKIINFATSLMDDSECYLEVGVFTGFSLCSAGYLNGKKCVGIDNFDMGSVGWGPDANVIREHCKGNIQKMTVNARLIESDFRAVTKEQIGSPVGVTFIDGRHEYKDVVENLEWVTPLLSDDAVLIFDDVGLEAVAWAIKSWWATHYKQFEILAYIKPHYVESKALTHIQDQVIHQGICIMRYSKNGFQ